MKKNDWILAGCLAGIGLAAFFALNEGKKAGAVVQVSVDGKEFGTYSLQEEREIPIGEGNLLLIRDGMASMTWADCPDKLCVRQGAVSKTGETIVCLPNRVTVRVEGEGVSRVDDMAG